MTELPLWAVLPFLFVVGTVVGSFLNVCIYRLPQHDTLWPQLKALSWPGSHCPSCKRDIYRSDNIPVLGWLKLGGRCRFCRIRISPRYPLIELFNGLLFVLVYWMEMPEHIRSSIADSCIYFKHGPQELKVWSDTAWLHWRYAYHMVLIEAMLVATFIDFDLWEIPDGSTVPAMIVGVLAGGLIGQVYLVPVWYQKTRQLQFFKSIMPESMHWMLSGPDVPAWIAAHPHLHGFAVSIVGLIVGGGIVWYVRIIGKWALRREAMGFGDVMLMAAIGSFIGWQPVLVVFFLAPFCAMFVALGSVIMRRGQEIPYGPYLSLATLVLLLFWKRIWLHADRVFETGAFAVGLIVTLSLVLAVCLQVIQLGKRLLGVPLYDPASEFETIEEWRSSDQLHYFAGETVDDQQGRWRTPRWPGTSAGMGRSHYETWRYGPQDGNRSSQLRRDSGR